eukprot:TRINITY_DN23773_c0_g2_i4.p1 TRINITY_DN23773_c0_g2~~TRINITY_DN23773_c0_g2_i4.p1  ORF type:complete len:743 (-),score=67.54 TRINITY_DN23773_c0_g2_i4:57-2285(-)
MRVIWKIAIVGQAAAVLNDSDCGPVIYLLHTASRSTPEWINVTLAPLKRPWALRFGSAPYVREHLRLSSLVSRFEKRADRLRTTSYFVFVDVDLVQPEVADLASFEKFLCDWKPAVGLPFLQPLYGHLEWFKRRQEVWVWAQWDDAVVAYSRHALQRLYSAKLQPATKDGGWVGRWWHRSWAGLLYPRQVLLTTTVHFNRRPSGPAKLPKASALQSYAQLLLSATSDACGGDRMHPLCVPHPSQAYSPAICDGGPGCEASEGCSQCGVPQPIRGSVSDSALAKPGCTVVAPQGVMSLWILVQLREHYSRLMLEGYVGSFSKANRSLAAFGLLPVEEGIQRTDQEVDEARSNFSACMSPGREEATMDELPPITKQVRGLPIRKNTFAYMLLAAGPDLKEACWRQLLKTDNVHILVVTWRQPLNATDLLRNPRVTTAFLPNSTMNEAKQAKHWIILEVQAAFGWRFDYVIRADSDACLAWDSRMSPPAREELLRKNSSAFDAFHAFLVRDRPAVGLPRGHETSYFSTPFNRSSGPWHLDKPSLLAYDHQFHAVSADALLFYTLDLAFEGVRWHIADVSCLYRLSALFAGRTLSFNAVEMDSETAVSTSASYMHKVGGDEIIPHVAFGFERTWLPLAHRIRKSLPAHLQSRALYSYWMEWESGDGVADVLPDQQAHANLSWRPPKDPSACEVQRLPHKRWHMRHNGVNLVMLLEGMLNNFAGRIRPPFPSCWGIQRLALSWPQID